MPESSYVFNDESIDDLRKKTIEDLNDTETRNTILFYKRSINELIRGIQKEKLDKRGFAIVINGSWGAGKSTATYALINALDNEESPLLRIDRSLLPFSNIDESITIYLNDLSDKLLNENLADIRSEVRQFILESTPQSDALSVGAGIGPISLSKQINTTKLRADNDERIREKLKPLILKNKTVVILIDDLDRLRPNEITPILRMVEKLRSLPRVLIILPIFKEVINKAIAKDLGLDEPSAATFLRKLTDVSIFIDNDLKALNDTFTTELSKLLGTTDFANPEWNASTVNLCWAMLLHVLIVEDSVAIIESTTNSGDAMNQIFSPQNSKYLSDFKHLLDVSNRQQTDAPYPMYENENGQEWFVRIGAVSYFGAITSMNDANATLNNLRGMVDNIGAIANVVTTEASVVTTLQSNTRMDFQKALEDSSSIPVFIEVLKPLLDSTRSEPLLENNYKKRDMNILAHMIHSGLLARFSVEDDENRLWAIFNVIKKEFSQFRR
jgi:hypothetical protein